MKTNINRPDTPLAATPEPQPVSSGLQASPQMGMVPKQRVPTKFEQTANNAIEQIKIMNPPPAAAPAAGAEQQQQQ
jgi:hypothetical protein